MNSYMAGANAPSVTQRATTWTLGTMVTRWYEKLLARLGNKEYICKYNLHDYPDSVEGEPWHFIQLTCKRCGTKFYI